MKRVLIAFAMTWCLGLAGTALAQAPAPAAQPAAPAAPAAAAPAPVPITDADLKASRLPKPRIEPRAIPPAR